MLETAGEGELQPERLLALVVSWWPQWAAVMGMLSGCS